MDGSLLCQIGRLRAFHTVITLRFSKNIKINYKLLCQARQYGRCHLARLRTCVGLNPRPQMVELAGAWISEGGVVRQVSNETTGFRSGVEIAPLLACLTVLPGLYGERCRKGGNA